MSEGKALEKEKKAKAIARKADIERNTTETKIKASVNLDGEGKYAIETGIGFFNHMLELFSKHSLIDVSLQAKGDLRVDMHHTVEDCGIVLGQAIVKALGDKNGIARYGWEYVPMDESLAFCAIDLSGRPKLVFDAKFPLDRVGEFPTELVEEFFQAVANELKANVHVKVVYGKNSHHMAEALFKAFARALRCAVEFDKRQKFLPSTKGML